MTRFKEIITIFNQLVEIAKKESIKSEEQALKLIAKRSNGGSENWNINDNKRSPFNVTKIKLSPNLNNAEAEDTGYSIDFLSNGFKIRNDGGDHNSSGDTYVYVAFAEHPFVSSEGVPVTAR